MRPEPKPREPIGPLCLVTGGAGYLGSHLVGRLLGLGYQVRSLDLRPCAIEHPRLEGLLGDITNAADRERACAGVSTLFHTAAVIDLARLCRPAARQRVMDVNVSGTAGLLDAARSAGVARFVHTSTVNVCFGREVVMGDESTPYTTQPLDVYTESKTRAEPFVLAADCPGGMRTVALRPGGLWGGSDGGVMLRTFLEQLGNGRFVALMGDGTAMADNTHVENLVDAAILAAAALVASPQVVGGQAYFITDGEPMNAIEWFQPLVQGLGYQFPRFRLPASILYGLGYMLEAVHFLGGPPPSLTRTGVLKVTQTHTFRIDKARRDLGYAPRIGRVEGLTEILPQARIVVESLRSGGPVAADTFRSTSR